MSLKQKIKNPYINYYHEINVNDCMYKYKNGYIYDTKKDGFLYVLRIGDTYKAFEILEKINKDFLKRFVKYFNTQDEIKTLGIRMGLSHLKKQGVELPLRNKPLKQQVLGEPLCWFFWVQLFMCLFLFVLFIFNC